MKERCDSFDLDGVLIGRLPFQLETSLAFLARHQRIYQPPDNIPPLDRRVSTRPIKGRERLALIFQTKRRLNKGVIEFLANEVSQVDLFGNTGRPNKIPWIEITEATLVRGGIRQYLKDIFFTPEGTSGLLSKAAVLKHLVSQYTKVRHVDDDPLVALCLAPLFPGITFVIKEDWSTRFLLSKVDLNSFSNVHRINHFQELINR